MDDKPQWWSRIPMWWPVLVGLVVIAGLAAETRWKVEFLLGEERAEQAEEEKLQWQAIGELNKHAYKSEEILKFHDIRIESLEAR